MVGFGPKLLVMDQLMVIYLRTQKMPYYIRGGAFLVGKRRLFSIWIGQEKSDQSKFRITPTKNQNPTRELTSFTAFSRLSRQPPVHISL